MRAIYRNLDSKGDGHITLDELMHRSPSEKGLKEFGVPPAVAVGEGEGESEP